LPVPVPSTRRHLSIRTYRRVLAVALGAVVVAVGALVVVGIRPHSPPGGPQISYRPPPYAPRGPYQQRLLERLVSGGSWVAPGATAYVAGPKGIWVGAAGLSNVQMKALMAPGARLRLNSVGKTWTAALILKLIGEGRMTLEDTVARWLPGLLPYGNQVTVADLLSMTSGMINTDDFSARPQYYLAKIKDPALRARVQAAARRAATNPTYPPTRVWIEAAGGVGLLYTPRSTWHYSNIGYMVLGLIAARVGGADLATLFRTQILDPLHLQSARYDPAPDISGPHAHGYSLSGSGELQDATRWTGGLAANGGIVSDAADEAHFLQALMRGQILRPAQLKAMETSYAFGGPAAAVLGSSASYGLGVVIQQDGCATPGVAYGHNGGGDGYMSSVQVSPDGRRVAVVLVNGYATTSAEQDAGAAAVITTMQRLYCSDT
jgi:D-alanyl-D-alanine carboxypeptidase